MADVTGGLLAAKMLEAEGVEYIFSLVGAHIYTLYDGCVEVGVRVIDVRHEAAAAHMAEGLALVTGRPGVCVVTAGPGFTNSLTGLANATVANSPVLLISGHSPLSGFDTGTPQDLNQIDIIKPLTKMSRTIYQSERIQDFYPAERIVGCDLPVRRYEKIVEVLGGYGEYVEDPDQIAPAIERAFASGKPACVNVATDPRVSPRKP